MSTQCCDETLDSAIDCDPQLMEMFVSSADELLNEIESDLLELERMSDDLDDELVNKVFRAAHTIKGESGFVGLSVIGSLAHSIENILDQMRMQKIPATGEVVDQLLHSFDYLRQLTQDIEVSQTEDISSELHDLQVILDHYSESNVKASKAEPVQAQPQAPVEPMTTKSTERASVLIVDDDSLAIKLITNHLDKNSISSCAEQTMQAALNRIKQEFIPVVILDIGLPDGSGLDMIPQLKQINPMVQIIMSTSNTEMPNLIQCLERGACDFVAKTGQFDELVGPVRNAVHRISYWRGLVTGTCEIR